MDMHFQSFMVAPSPFSKKQFEYICVINKTTNLYFLINYVNLHLISILFEQKFMTD